MPTDVEKLIREIRSLSPEERERARQALGMETPTGSDDTSAPSREPTDVEYQERLVKAGLLTAVKRRRRDQRAFDGFKPIDISGKPLSKTIIEERR